jgi:L-cysteine desulfidase
VEDIVRFADIANLDDVRDVLEKQINLNTAIANEGINGEYGAGIGKIMLASFGSGVADRAKAMAAAGSDARMSGCELPVVINSGSGNQGITASVPVIVYAKDLKKDRDTLLRALLVSNLVTIHLKTGIGRLSAYCGAISAGCGAGAGIMYLHGGRQREVAHTVVNALAINSGVICDGAKASCAAKIVSSVEAGLLGMYMYMRGSEFFDGDGIVTKGVESTIRNVGELAREGMRETDKKIIRLMLGQN